MISGQVEGGDVVVQRLGHIAANIRPKIRASIGRLVLLLQRAVKNDKLNGQALNRRTGRLSRSIDQVVLDSGTDITGIVSTNVIYARIHEYGGVIHMPPRQQLLHFRKNAKTGIIGNRFVKKSKANTTKIAMMKGHDIVMPEHSFLRSALREMQAAGTIQAELKKAMSEAIHG